MILLTALLVSSILAVGLGIVVMEYFDGVEVPPDAPLMKYGLCVQVWGFIISFFIYSKLGHEIIVPMTVMTSLMGAGLFVLGSISVARVLSPHRKVAFWFLTLGIQFCVCTFFLLTTTMVPA